MWSGLQTLGSISNYRPFKITLNPTAPGRLAVTSGKKWKWEACGIAGAHFPLGLFDQKKYWLFIKNSQIIEIVFDHKVSSDLRNKFRQKTKQKKNKSPKLQAWTVITEYRKHIVATNNRALLHLWPSRQEVFYLIFLEVRYEQSTVFIPSAGRQQGSLWSLLFLGKENKPEWVGEQEKAQEAEGNEQQMFHTQEGKQHL